MTRALSPPFEDALADLRISGSVLLRDAYQPPWAIDIPGEGDLQKLMGVSREMRVVPFHFVIAGCFGLSHGKRKTIAVGTKDVAICLSGEPHRMHQGGAARSVPLKSVLSGAERPARSRARCGSNETSLLCGVFLIRKSPLNPMLSALPPVLKVATAGNGASPMLARAAEMLSLEVDMGQRDSFTASRLLEVFCAEAIRTQLETSGAQERGWFRALKDPRIAEALGHFHRSPGEPWSVGALAATVALSPSRFAARFRELMGESVMTYVARWRMNVACKLLSTTDAGLDQIADGAGYQNTAAFSRAFKAIVGQSPAKWRATATQ